jgi:hypothetical protein
MVERDRQIRLNLSGNSAWLNFASNKLMAVSLNQIVPWGRSKAEYDLMFALDEADYDLRILGCGDGPASFNAEASCCGCQIISIDPLYDLSGTEIARRFEDVVEPMISQVRAAPEDWVWTYHLNPDHLRQNRRQALQTFLADYDTGRVAGRYRTARLPTLPFVAGEFDLAVCSHLLFLYSEILDCHFHIASVRELCRVATEVRIFPLLTLAREISPHLAPVCAALAADGWQTEIIKVNYEFLKGGNEMLRIYRLA